MTEVAMNGAVAGWLRHVAEYPAALAQASMREAMERGDLGGVLRELARKAERDTNLALALTAANNQIRETEE